MPDTELDDLVDEEWSLSFPRFTHDDARAVGGRAYALSRSSMPRT
ncbi:hypothetical protein [Microbacterium lacus]